jgi:hypothetical protein
VTRFTEWGLFYAHSSQYSGSCWALATACLLKARISESQRASIARQRLCIHGSVSLSGWQWNRFTRQRIRVHNRCYHASEKPELVKFPLQQKQLSTGA